MDGDTEYWRVDTKHSCWKHDEDVDAPHLAGREITWLTCRKCGQDLPSYRITAEEFEAGRAQLSNLMSTSSQEIAGP